MSLVGSIPTRSRQLLVALEVQCEFCVILPIKVPQTGCFSSFRDRQVYSSLLPDDVNSFTLRQLNALIFLWIVCCPLIFVTCAMSSSHESGGVAAVKHLAEYDIRVRFGASLPKRILVIQPGIYD